LDQINNTLEHIILGGQSDFMNSFEVIAIMLEILSEDTAPVEFMNIVALEVSSFMLKAVKRDLHINLVRFLQPLHILLID